MSARFLAMTLAGMLMATPIVTAAEGDPVRDAQWHLEYLDVAAVHKYTQGEGVVVGIIDTGVDAKHPDLAHSVLPGMDLTVEATKDGRRDVDGHGTAVAGLIVANGRSLGIAPKASVVPMRNHVYRVSPASSGEAIEKAIDQGARVLCLAFGEPDTEPARQAVARAIANDIVVVAAIGNEPQPSSQQYPAAYPGVIAAAGVDRNGEHAAISVVAPHAVLAAPAVEIASTDIRINGRTGYSTGTGTSNAAAIIAGAAALVRSKFPDLSATEVIHRLTATADDKGPPGRDPQYGYGVVNLVKALTADVPPLTPSPRPDATPDATAAPPPDPDGGTPTRTIVIGTGVLIVLLTAAAAAITIARRRAAGDT